MHAIERNRTEIDTFSPSVRGTC